MKNKYYIDIKKTIEKLIDNEEYSKALKLINEELSMPYIPMDFENYLIDNLKRIPAEKIGSDFTLSLEKVVDLLIQLDENKENFNELINQLKKYNLSQNKEEISYFFSKTKNIRNRIKVFDILCESNVDIELEYGNPNKVIAINKNKEFNKDLKVIKNKLQKYPLLIDPAMELLYEIYLSNHININNDKNDYYDLVIFTISRIFKQEEILELIDNMDKLKNKIESFVPLT